LAVEAGNFEMVQWIVEKGADLSAQNSSGNTAVFAAAKAGRLDIVLFLIEQIEKSDKEKSEAKKTELLEISNALKETALLIAAAQGKWDVVNFLLGKGADFNAEDKWGNNLLLIAVRSGELPVVRWLEHKVDLHRKNDSGETALLLAVGSGNLVIAEFLIQCGGDINTKNSIGQTIVLAAASRNRWDIVEWLIKQPGIDLNVQNSVGDNVLLLAAKSGEWKLVGDLITNPNIVLTVEISANILSMAIAGAQTEIVNLMQRDAKEIMDSPMLSFSKLPHEQDSTVHEKDKTVPADPNDSEGNEKDKAVIIKFSAPGT
jgi:ankyrin repeat protein